MADIEPTGYQGPHCPRKSFRSAPLLTYLEGKPCCNNGFSSFLFLGLTKLEPVPPTLSQAINILAINDRYLFTPTEKMTCTF